MMRTAPRAIVAAIRMLALAASASLAAMVVAAAVLMQPLAPPDFAEVKSRFTPSESYLLDRGGELIDAQRVEFGARRSLWQALDDISPAFVAAVIGGEDRRFWRHGGVDWLSVAGAVRDNLVRHHLRGASTISMQLATLLDEQRRSRRAPRGASRKLRQARLALGLEARWSKREILEAYLNLLQFRGELQGIGAAAEVLAGKAPSGLSLSEGYVLAALLPNPGAPAASVAARACARAASANAPIDCAQLARTAATLLDRSAQARYSERLAPHLAGALLKSPGQAVRTTLDARIQRVARDALARQLGGLADRNVRDGAAIVVDNASGDVLAYVGSAGPNSRSSQVDGVRAPRQAGSTLKPFLYELALERRYLTAASLLDDSPLNIDTASGVYIPQDYDHDFKGAVSVRTALGGSLNVPAVRTLVLVGVEPFRDRLHALGYAGLTQDGEFYGYSLALGSAEVTLWEQAQAYRTLARSGHWSPLRIRADDVAPGGRRLMPDEASFVVGDVLGDRAARTLTFGLNNQLNTNFWSAVKTGTSKDMRDNWCIGYTLRYTVAVWVGNFEGDSMHEVSGVTGAAPAWREIIDALYVNDGSSAPPAPAGVRSAWARYAPAVEPPRREWFLAGTEPMGAIEAVARRDRLPHIASPANGMIIAIDPDIPPDRQRVAITVQGGAADLVVRLNDVVLGAAADPLSWQPSMGPQRLVLEDRQRRTLDRVLFTVR